MFLNGDALEYVDSVTYLGVLLSHDMKDDADMSRHLRSFYARSNVKGVDLDTKVGGTDWCVTQPFPPGGLGRCKPPSGVRGRAPEANAFWQTYFAN